MIKAVYFGSPNFSAYLLSNLIDFFSIQYVITQPPRPVGRRKILQKTAVSKLAAKFNIPVLETSSPDLSSLGSILQKADVAIVFAYGAIIPKEILELPQYGFFNLHPSLLPKFRGASPVAYPLCLGEKILGVSWIKMDEKIDHGPLLAQAKVNISSEELREDVYLKLTQIGLELIKQIARAGFSQIKLFEQNHNYATYTRILKKDDGFLNPFLLTLLTERKSLSINLLPKFLKEYIKTYPFESFDNLSLFSLFRGLHPWPGIWTLIKIKGEKKRLKITEVDVNSRIKSVQLEGKNEVDLARFERAYGNLKELLANS